MGRAKISATHGFVFVSNVVDSKVVINIKKKNELIVCEFIELRNLGLSG